MSQLGRPTSIVPYSEVASAIGMLLAPSSPNASRWWQMLEPRIGWKASRNRMQRAFMLLAAAMTRGSPSPAHTSTGARRIEPKGGVWVAILQTKRSANEERPLQRPVGRAQSVEPNGPRLEVSSRARFRSDARISSEHTDRRHPIGRGTEHSG